MISKIKEFVKNIIDIMGRPYMLTLPSTLAYYFVLSAVPIISIVLLVATSFNLSASFITEFIENNFSTELMNLLTPMVTKQSLSFGYLVYLFMAFYIASNGSNSIIIASNNVFNIENAHFFKRRLKAFLITAVIFLLFLFLLIVPLFGEQILSICDSMGVNNKIVDAIGILYPVLKIPITLIVIFYAIKFIYIIAPDDKVKAAYVNKGAIFTTLLWFVATMVYSYFIKHMAHYNIYYAGLSTIVVLMIWMYILAFVFVMGLSMNYRNVSEQIEKTNTIKLKELEEKVKASKKK